MSLTAFNRMRRNQTEAKKINKISEKVEDIENQVKKAEVEIIEEKEQLEKKDTASIRRNNRKQLKMGE